MFCKRGVLRNFAKFTGKYLYQTFFFNKVAGLRFATLLKRRLWHRCFPVNFAKFLKTSFLAEHLWWLLLCLLKLIFFVVGIPENRPIGTRSGKSANHGRKSGVRTTSNDRLLLRMGRRSVRC